MIKIVLLLLLSVDASASEVCKLSQENILKSLSMSYLDFDQSPGKGFRELHAKACYLSAAMLIDAWHLHNFSRLKPIESSTSYFHAGQNYAYEGEVFYPIAIQRFEQALLTDKKSIEEFKFWNPFVTATIARFKNDKQTIVQMRRKLEALPKSEITKQYIEGLNSLLENADRPYLQDQPKSRE